MAPLSRKQIRQRGKIQKYESKRQRAKDLRGKMMKYMGFQSDVRVAAVQVVGHEEHDGVTYFRLRMTASEGDGHWEVAQRYSAFHSLRKELGVRERRVGSLFPKKTGLFKCKESQLWRRQQLLESWINGLLAEFASYGDGRHAIIPTFRGGKLTKLQHFLGIDKEGQLLHQAHRPMSMDEVVNDKLVEGVENGSLEPSPRTPVSFQPSAPPPEVDQDLELALTASSISQKAEYGIQLNANLEAVSSLVRPEEQTVEEARCKAPEEDVEQQAIQGEEARCDHAKMEEEAMCIAAEEEAEHQKQQEEERHHVEQIEKPLLDRAIELFIKAQSFEAQGELQQALQHYQSSAQVFEILKESETSEQIRSAIERKIHESKNRAFKIQEVMNAEEVGHMEQIRVEQSAGLDVTGHVNRVIVAET